MEGFETHANRKLQLTGKYCQTMRAENPRNYTNTSQTTRARKLLKPHTYAEEAKPQGLYPTTDRVSNEARKRKIQPRRDPTQVFPKLAKTPKDKVVE